MQARAYPACLPGPASAGCGRRGLLSSTGSVGRRAPAGRGRAASVRAVDGASAAAAVAAAADAAQLPHSEITWQIVVGAVGESVLHTCVASFPLSLVALPEFQFVRLAVTAPALDRWSFFAAGVTPFVVAGVEFSKRIFAQKKCEVCGGSGLVMKKDYYVRCQGCGGFLPWQSWRRFFTG
ncbi:unnamed protein product [Urochloa decumbens]|uniref:Uncharacterized protein n=1 Tax=Urochloa decumbens TaxID=240449 RepID=A0ABC8ZHV2_9POAL